MISKEEIDRVLAGYNLKKVTIGTVCSHSALQIFHGARQEGFNTLGICLKSRKSVYDAFPLARPDEYLLVDDFDDILDSNAQDKMISDNVIIIPHGSFIEYVGSRNLQERFHVPMFGNRTTLEWESDREKQRKWLETAGLKMPKEYTDPSEIDGRVFVKFSGAKGGKGFFTAGSEKEYYERMEERVKKGLITRDSSKAAIQEFIPGVRYYHHYFYSLFKKFGLRIGEGSLELLSMDKRIEPIDECYRGLPDVPDEFYDYTVTGNQPIIIRESLLPAVLEMGSKTVDASINLFHPGMLGAFSLETIYQPSRGFTVFEISARIVAGTNLYPEGSPYSFYLFKEPMSTGRRISREIKEAIKRNSLERTVF